MKKDDLKNDIKRIQGEKPPYQEQYFLGRYNAYENTLKLIDQLDEPEKVVIPQFVADWIEKCGEDSQNLYGVYHFAPSKVSNWVFNDRTNLIARAWLDGYAIEQPKLLTVIVKDYDKTIMSKQMPEDEVEKMMEGME